MSEGMAMHEGTERLTAEAVESMARVAGLKVDRERARRLRDDLEPALAAVDALEAAIATESPGTGGVGDFDAGWSDSRGRERA